MNTKSMQIIPELMLYFRAWRLQWSGIRLVFWTTVGIIMCKDLHTQEFIHDYTTLDVC